MSDLLKIGCHQAGGICTDKILDAYGEGLASGGPGYISRDID